jgi:hypothetical protein
MFVVINKKKRDTMMQVQTYPITQSHTITDFQYSNMYLPGKMMPGQVVILETPHLPKCKIMY